MTFIWEGDVLPDDFEIYDFKPGYIPRHLDIRYPYLTPEQGGGWNGGDNWNREPPQTLARDVIESYELGYLGDPLKHLRRNGPMISKETSLSLAGGPEDAVDLSEFGPTSDPDPPHSLGSPQRVYARMRSSIVSPEATQSKGTPIIGGMQHEHMRYRFETNCSVSVFEFQEYERLRGFIGFSYTHQLYDYTGPTAYVYEGGPFPFWDFPAEPGEGTIDPECGPLFTPSLVIENPGFSTYDYQEMLNFLNGFTQSNIPMTTTCGGITQVGGLANFSNLGSEPACVVSPIHPNQDRIMVFTINASGGIGFDVWEVSPDGGEVKLT